MQFYDFSGVGVKRATNMLVRRLSSCACQKDRSWKAAILFYFPVDADKPRHCQTTVVVVVVGLRRQIRLKVLIFSYYFYDSQKYYEFNRILAKFWWWYHSIPFGLQLAQFWKWKPKPRPMMRRTCVVLILWLGCRILGA